MEGKLGNAVWTENDMETFLSTKATFKEHLRIHTEKAASRKDDPSDPCYGKLMGMLRRELIATSSGYIAIEHGYPHFLWLHIELIGTSSGYIATG